MADDSEHPLPLSDRALEMIMRDVLDGLQEFSLQSTFDHVHGGFEIVAIDPPSASTQLQSTGCEVLDFPGRRRATG